ncbi:COG1361 S-layer family protein [Halorussus halophilus]|uniref:COG1361 S-layer family protein n=1 Tax=Halorussus halophilus TaxID=2650975 RepID=UPI0013017FBC|nr:COG1361 S-layer family protein [Halorussus halophilus]
MTRRTSRRSFVVVVVALLLVSSAAFAVAESESVAPRVEQQTATTDLPPTSSPTIDGETTRSPPTTQRGGTTLTGSTSDFVLVSTSTNAPVDGTGSLSLTFRNVGETVSNASVVVQSPNESVRFGPSQSARRSLGEWVGGERRTVTFDLLVEEFAEVRTYPFMAFVRYTAANGTRQRAGPYIFDVQPSQRIQLDRFEVTRIASDAQAGETGTISVTIENTGPDVRDAVVTLRSLNDQLRFGRRRNASQFVGEWSSSESITFDYRVRTSNDTLGGSYPFVVSVSYLANGSRQRSTSKVFGVVPAPEQSFAFSNVTSTLRVGDEGTVSGTLTNQGPAVARDAVLVLRSRSDTFFPREREYALGTLERGQSERFRFRIDVSDSADRGPRQLSLFVRYRNRDGDSLRSDPLTAQVLVRERRDEFVVEPIRVTVEAGSSAEVTLRITNNDDRILRSIDARSFVDSPLSLDDNQAFVTRLAPNETTNISFRVSADAGALAGTYPLTLDFQYETPDGEKRLSDTYELPIRVVQPERDGLFSFLETIDLPILGAAVLLGLVAVVLVAIRRWR